eukprot:TRINITY_DN6860_c0_g1_i1.p1 TRINITY_DN6860_c0_g1~~TRINITY_DN6860_c0_g1_i1.p1  ORF type:complete len:574 (+),score=115.76 TRINITY_DN6860_c0_g1_i1:1287-3008(+)
MPATCSSLLVDPFLGLPWKCTCPTGFNELPPWGCEDISECALYGCNGSDSVVKCTEVAPNQRTCTCLKLGFGFNGQQSTTLIGNETFGGCEDIDECKFSGCGIDSLATCSQDTGIPNSRTCTCPEGTYGTATLFGNTPFGGCTDIDECVTLGCGPYECENGENQRTCICPQGFHPQIMIFVGTERFTDCNDIDECASNPSPCEKYCNNTYGSYFCACDEGESLGKNGSCVAGEGTNMGVIAGVVGGVVAGCVLLIIIGVILMRRYLRLNLNLLPPDVRWQYENYQQHSSSWETRYVGRGSYYVKQLKPGMEDWKRMSNILHNLLGGVDLQIDEAEAVFNTTLVSNFINARYIIGLRLGGNASLFDTKNWKFSKNADEKEFVYSNYTNIVAASGWNKADEVPIIATVHGTSYHMAKSICSTGFAALSLLDAGYYGRGIYFTTSSAYAANYISGKSDPALIISFVTPGNVFPVTEHHAGSESLIGQALKSGYNSHFALVNTNGEIPKSGTTSIFTEVVVQQESQITPVYIVKLCADTVSKMKTFPSSRDTISRDSNGNDGYVSLEDSTLNAPLLS